MVPVPNMQKDTFELIVSMLENKLWITNAPETLSVLNLDKFVDALNVNIRNCTDDFICQLHSDVEVDVEAAKSFILKNLSGEKDPTDKIYIFSE
jgi:hypothetical protein